ncbi:MAG: hypothetical protein JNN07_16715 [Verrucomicrobiales bacterium]|nr:hypothetical protein [Verrucomicrobiales bacterium]
MSLINDALKRANEQKAKHVSAGELGSTMQTVEASSDETRLWPIALFAVLLVGALWLGWSGIHSGSSPEPENPGPTEVNARVTEPALAPPPTASPDSTGLRSAVGTVEPLAPDPAKVTAFTPPRALPTSEAPPVLPLAPLPAPQARAALAPKTDSPASVAPATPPAPAVAGSTPSSPPNTFPKLSLQGIYYRPSRPSAVINSKTVFVGDRVQQAKILAIDRYEVTVQWNNEVRVLAFQ